MNPRQLYCADALLQKKDDITDSPDSPERRIIPQDFQFKSIQCLKKGENSSSIGEPKYENWFMLNSELRGTSTEVVFLRKDS